MGSTEICYYVYAAAGKDQPAQLVWTGAGVQTWQEAIDNFSQNPWHVVDFGDFPCGTPVPPPTPGPAPAPTPPGSGGGPGGEEPPSSGAPPIFIPPGGGGGGGTLPAPPGGQPDPDGDQLLQCCQATTGWLATIAAELAAWEAKQGGGSSANSQCCANVISAINRVSLAIGKVAQAIAAAGSGSGGAPPPPVDLTPIVAELTALAAAAASWPGLWTALNASLVGGLGGIASAISQQGGTDVSGIVKVLEEIFQTIDTPIAMYQALANQGYFDANYLGYFGQGATAPAGAYRALVGDWDMVRNLVKKWLGYDIGEPGKFASAPPAGPGLLTDVLTKFFTGSDNVITPILGPLVNTLKGQLSPGAVPPIGSAGVDPNAAVNTGVAIVFSGILASWLASFTGIAGGPPLAEMARDIANAIGFGSLTQVQIAPLVDHGIRKTADMNARAAFRQEIPGVGTLQSLVARGLLASNRATQLTPFTGIPPELEPLLQASSYGGLNARLLLRLIETNLFTPADVTDELTFDGMRQASQQRLLQAAPYLSTASQRNQYVSALEAAYVAGLYSDQQLQSAVQNAQTIVDLETLVLLTAKVKKLVAETKALEAEYSTLFKAGLLDDATFRADLSALGLQADMVNTVAARAEAQANATLQRRTISEQNQATRATNAAARRDAVQRFKSGTIDAAALLAALTVAGATPLQAAALVDLAQQSFAGTQKWTYGLQLTQPAAKLLTDRVAAISAQLAKGLITDDQFNQQLTALGIPPTYINVAHAKAAAAKASGPLATLTPVLTS